MPKEHDFKTDFEYSKTKQEFDKAILKKHFAKVDDVKIAPKEMDKQGVDYIVVLEGGATINIDAKTRRPGSSKYWKFNEPEVVLEKWSEIPDKEHGREGKVGWTVNGSYKTDYVLYTFSKEDSKKYYIIPYHLLKTAFHTYGKEWYEMYGEKKEPNKGYIASSTFVPISVVIKKINEMMVGKAYE